MAAAEVLDPGIVLVGVAKSGTTLIRVLFDSQPRMACGPETGLFLPSFEERRLERLGLRAPELRTIEAQSTSHADFAAAVLREHARCAGNDHWAEKTPRNIWNMGWILDRFPNAQLVHGRSLRPCRGQLAAPRSSVRGATGQAGTHRRRASSRGVRRPVALRGITRRRMRISPPRLGALQEDAATDPQGALTPVLERVGLAWTDDIRDQAMSGSTPAPPRAMITSPNATAKVDLDRVDAWRVELSQRQSAVAEATLRPLLDRYGYR